MTNLVPRDEIERLVGVPRHPTNHYGRASTVDQTIYILHSQQCLDSGIDLRVCRFSRALDHGASIWEWMPVEETPVVVAIGDDGCLVPA